MDEQHAAWEGVAEAFLDAIGLGDPPVDAFEVAAMCRLRVVYGVPARLEGQTVFIPPGQSLVRTHGTLAHEIAHHVLDLYDELNDEEAADELATRILLERRRFDRDLSTTAWSLPALRGIHRYASAERIGHRITHVRDAVVSIYDQGRLKTRLISPWLDARFSRVDPWEQALVDECYATGELVIGDSLIKAWPLFSGPHRRVVLVAEAEQLSLRW